MWANIRFVRGLGTSLASVLGWIRGEGRLMGFLWPFLPGIGASDHENY
jgi:hypothetical protein